MALTQTQVSQLYVAIFGRASEGEGNTYWQTGSDMASVATDMLATPDATEYFGGDLTDQEFVEFIYLNTLSKTVAEDPEGIQYWVDQLAEGTSRGQLVTDLVVAAMAPENAGPAQDQFINRVEVSNYTADTVATAPADYKTSLGFQSPALPDSQLIVTDDPATVSSAKENVDALASIFTLTNGTDIATAGVFDAPMVYTPDGSDRILSLQDEDQLTGLGDNATLNVVLGNTNADEGTTATVTPVLKNISTLNIDWTGNTNTLDLRYSDSVEKINVNKMTSDAGATTVQNITTVASDLRVANVHDNTSAITFDYVRGVLDGNEDTMTLDLDNVLMNAITVQADGGLLNEGYETANLTVSNGVDIRGALSITDMENLNISGDGFVDILNQVWTSNEYNAFTPALANPGSIGQRTIDLSDFSGTSNIDISLNLGRNVDPNASGAEFYGVTTGGTGDDTFHTNVAVAATSSTSHNIIDGGEGNNTLVSYAGTVAGLSEITNIETLELRDQTAVFGVTDMDAFDDKLTSIFMRDEDAGATTFTLNNMTVDQATSAMTLAHSISVAGAQTVAANLKDATGTDDTMAISVVNDLNTGTTFNYTLAFEGMDTDGIAAGAAGNADAIENVTIHDNDTESNTVTLANITEHTGTTTLDGGQAGNTFTVAGTLNSAVVDAANQVSDLRLTVGDTVGTPITTVTQDIKLGTGDDVLTYANIDELDATDSLTDAGGNDTVRAAFSKDSNPDITGIENLDVTATANVTLGMANADITNLVILANSATAGSADLDNNGVRDMNIAGSGITTNIITLDNSTLTELNFFGDADTDDLLGNTVGGVDNVVAHTFNGVTLDNNTANDITVNINTSLDINESAATGGGAATYTIGQITTHGNTGMDIVVGNERINAGTTTTINNIYAKSMETLTATATGNLNLGTVSGAPLNNSLKTFDMSAVGGAVTANVISLGDDAVVTLADGNNTVSILGSAGKNITMTAGNGNNTLTGSAQKDYITTGSGWDAIAADRGDNVITAGAGNDTVTAKDGNDTVDLGTGIDSFVDNLGTGIDASLATNTVSMSGGVASVQIDVKGDGIPATTDVDQVLAVGNGSDLTVSWNGATMNSAGAVLDGALANTITTAGAATATASADLNIVTTTGTANGKVLTVTASDGNDVTIFNGATTFGATTVDGIKFNGGAGNDAVVATRGTDEINGGTGADNIAVSNLKNTADLFTDIVTVADGDSLASGWDTIAGWDVDSAAAVTTAVAGGTAQTGSDILNLDSTTIATAADNTALTTNITTANGTVVDDVTFNANGLVTFSDNSIVGVGGVAVNVGTATNEVSLGDALSALAVELNGTGKTAVFAYDSDGDGLFTAADSVFVFQDGVNDTVVELVGTGTAGVVTGLTLAGTDAAGDTFINII